MKKTAVVSCYFQPNYGSMLQALATQMALDKLGFENETVCIDGLSREIRRAKVLYFAKASLTSDILLSKAGMAMAQIRRRVSGGTYPRMIRARREAFRSFSEKWFRMSEAYPSRRALGDACRERYGTVLVGSDQLWLPANIAADYYTLSFVPDEVNTVAYATSFGQSELPRDSERAAAGFLPRIRHISVRERSGQKLVKRICGRRVPVVADPTLLFTGEEWMCVQEEKPLFEGEYIFCYFLGSNRLHREFASRLSGETGCRIIALPHIDEYVHCDADYADETPWEVGPSEFLNLIRNAAWVCTDSYHCTAFSMLYEKRFFTFRRYSRRTRQSTNSRIDTLLSQCGLPDRLLEGTEEAAGCVKAAIDYESVRSRIGRIRRSSWKYLSDAMLDRSDTDLDSK